MNFVSCSWVAKCGFKLKKGCLKKVGIVERWGYSC